MSWAPASGHPNATGCTATSAPRAATSGCSGTWATAGKAGRSDPAGGRPGMSLLPGRETLACPRVLVRAHLGRVGFGPVLALGRPGGAAARVRVLAAAPGPPGAVWWGR